MKKIVLLFIITLILTGCGKKNITNEIQNDNKNEDIKESEIVKNINIKIDNNNYILNLENNAASNKLISLLPLSLKMNELNGNEKYVYLDEIFPTSSYKPKHINKGDVMLYGDNCLVIFYKSFDTSYSYTKIGHIDNLSNLGNSNVNVSISVE